MRLLRSPVLRAAEKIIIKSDALRDNYCFPCPWLTFQPGLFRRQAPSHYLADIIGQGPGPGYAT